MATRLSRSLLALGAGLALAFVGCTKAPDPWAGTSTGQKKVIASFAPLYCFAANVAGDKARVVCLLTGVSPHEYDVNDTDAGKVAKADLFLINGLELDETFAAKLNRTKTGPTIIELGEKIPHKLLIHTDEDEKHDETVPHHHHHGDHDPHIWLGLAQARALVDATAKALGDADAANAETYKTNAKNYNEELTKVEEYGKKAFESKKNRAFIATHDSLHYFAKTFGLDFVDAITPVPNMEADANQLTKLVELCKAKNIGVLAVEPKFSRNQAERLAKAVKNAGVDIKIIEIDPMETCVPDSTGNPSPKLYVEKMKKNIDNLAGALP
jgi:zinc transport system substrate-binding protein